MKGPYFSQLRLRPKQGDIKGGKGQYLPKKGAEQAGEGEGERREVGGVIYIYTYKGSSVKIVIY